MALCRAKEKLAREREKDFYQDMEIEMRSLIKGNTDALLQLYELLGTLTPEQYTDAPNGVQYGIGRHVRHILDQYLALKDGENSGLVDYDKRHRDSPVEKDANMARKTIQDMTTWLAANLGNQDRAMTVSSEAALNETVVSICPSYISRELLYLANHTVHHIAYIALLAKFHGVAVDESFGVAPTTASFLHEERMRVSG